MRRSRALAPRVSCAFFYALALAACGADSPGAPRSTQGTPAGSGTGGASGVAASSSGGAVGSGGGTGGVGMGGAGGAGGSGTGGALSNSSGGTSGGHNSPLPAPDPDALLDTGCATSTTRSQLLPSNMLFVIDRSASMACNPPPVTDSAACELDPTRIDPMQPSKWEITRSALKAAIGALPRETIVGLSFFSNDDACGVHSLPTVPLAKLGDPESAQSSAIKASLDNVEPNGATPLVGATILAYKHLHDLALAGEIHGKQFVVLLTDGEQSDPCSDPSLCSDPQSCTSLLVDQEVGKAAGKGVGIRTFVIGAPGSEPARKVLSQMAVNGGTAPANCDVDAGNCHFDMTQQSKFDEALADALSKIAGRALSCELPLPSTTEDVDPKFVNVVYSPADGSKPSLILKDDRKGCDDGADGWQYATDANKIRLCGPTCDLVRKDRGARVDVVLGCAVRGPE